MDIAGEGSLLRHAPATKAIKREPSFVGKRRTIYAREW
jgi:hypothetical protein